MHVNAQAAAIDLARAQVDKVERPRRHAAFFADAPRAYRACMASGTIITGFFIRAYIIALLRGLQVSLLNRDAEPPG